MCLNLNIGGLRIGDGPKHLMDYNARTGKRVPFSFRPGSQEKGPHAGRLTDTDGSHVGLDLAHRVVDSQTGSYTSAGRIDIDLDVLLRIHCLQRQKL